MSALFPAASVQVVYNQERGNDASCPISDARENASGTELHSSGAGGRCFTILSPKPNSLLQTNLKNSLSVENARREEYRGRVSHAVRRPTSYICTSADDGGLVE